MSDAAILTEGFSKSFGARAAVSELNLRIQRERCMDSWGATARGKRRRCACCWGWYGRRREARGCWGSIHARDRFDAHPGTRGVCTAVQAALRLGHAGAELVRPSTSAYRR